MVDQELKQEKKYKRKNISGIAEASGLVAEESKLKQDISNKQGSK